jgi:hypothetical protein
VFSRFLLGFALVWVAAARNSDLTIMVQVTNLAGVPEKTLRDAERLAGYVFLKTGVHVNWLAAGPEAGVTDIPIRLLRGRPDQKLHGDAAGFAELVPGNASAGVYYQVALDAADSLRADVAGILGAAIAHEIGHVLLNSAAHSRAGIMRPRLGRMEARMAERGELLFTSEEGNTIRESVMRLRMAFQQHL